MGGSDQCHSQRVNMFALIDCNNFYVSCERAFNPKLENKPVVVLSNNDGCIISRSNEAKKLKIPMGAPYFKWESFCKKNSVQVFSSNYELYGDMSQRVMSFLKEFDAQCEIYSIDEAFIKFSHAISFEEFVLLRKKIKNSTGIPVSVGLGETKTLAKLANHLAKTLQQEGVFIIDEKEFYRLNDLPVDKVWGVGFRLSNKLKLLHIETVKQLQEANAKWIRLNFNVNLEKTVQELNGVSCYDLENITIQPRKQIITSRSFGKKLTHLSDLEEAVSHYAHIATKKLRQQNGRASALYVFLQTSLFQQANQYANGMMLPFPTPTADTCYIIHSAKKCLQRIYKKNYVYHKVGVMLLDIQLSNMQYDLLNSILNEKKERLMQAMDALNLKMGKNTVFIAAEGIKREWLMKFNRRSPRYTTRWNELPTVFCD